MRFRQLQVTGWTAEKMDGMNSLSVVETTLKKREFTERQRRKHYHF